MPERLISKKGLCPNQTIRCLLTLSNTKSLFQGVVRIETVSAILDKDVFNANTKRLVTTSKIKVRNKLFSLTSWVVFIQAIFPHS